LDIYSASSLTRQSTGRHVAPLGHSLLIQEQLSLCFYPFSAVCLMEKQQLPIS